MTHDEILKAFLEEKPRWKKLDLELIQRWAWSAHHHGDKEIKKEMASAKRTATILDKARHEYVGLSVEQRQQFAATTESLHSYVGKLTQVAKWASEFRAFADSIQKFMAEKAYNAWCEQRWPNPEDLDFEFSIFQELHTHEGRCNLARWFYSLGKYQEIEPSKFRLFHGMRQPTTKESPKQYRRNCIYTEIHSGMHFKHTTTDSYDRNVTVGLDDYEAYLAYRRELAAITAQTLKAFRVTST